MRRREADEVLGNQEKYLVFIQLVLRLLFEGKKKQQNTWKKRDVAKLFHFCLNRRKILAIKSIKSVYSLSFNFIVF